MLTSSVEDLENSFIFGDNEHPCTQQKAHHGLMNHEKHEPKQKTTTMMMTIQTGIACHLTQHTATATTMTMMTIINEDVLATGAMEISTIQIAQHHMQMETTMTMETTATMPMPIKGVQ